MKLQSLDTSLEIEVLQLKLLREAGATFRGRQMLSLSIMARRMALFGLKKLHPVLSDWEVDLLFVLHTYSPELAEQFNSYFKARQKKERLMNEHVMTAFSGVVVAFEKLGIPYLIGGSVASSVYGVPRATNDADLVADIKHEQILTLIAELEADYYISEVAVREAVSRKTFFNVLHQPTVTKVDIFILKSGSFEQIAFARRQQEQIDPDNPKLFYLSSPEDIILQKLLWYEMGGQVANQQWLDITGLLKIQGATLDRNYLQSWAGQLSVTDLLAQALTDAGIN
jgi:hypothetical protein